jgi:copper chaperone CopZ
MIDREENMIVEILRVSGMRGEHDRRAVVAAVTGLPGVRRAVANAADGTLRLERDPTASLAAIISAVEAAGYRVAVLA